MQMLLKTPATKTVESWGMGMPLVSSCLPIPLSLSLGFKNLLTNGIALQM